MMTQTHILMGSALFSRRGNAAVNWAAAVGGLVPDVPMYVLLAWDHFVMKYSFHQIFDERYFTDTWAVPVSATHSFVLLAIPFAIGLWLKRDWLWVFGAAGLVHAADDFLVHREDAHMHFWPLSRWMFMSPVSYYDSAHYGNYMRPFELFLLMVMGIVVWRRFGAWWARIIAILPAMVGIAVPLFFMVVLGGQPD
jgi:hypothetical protein